MLPASCFLLLASSAFALTVDNFEQYETGKFPSSWRTWPFQRGKAMEVYKVEGENGNKFLHAFDDKDVSVQTLRDFYWKVNSYPVLSWRWRARELPKGANELNNDLNDSACGVYVVLSKARQMMLKYAWSTTAPKGSFREKVKDKAYIIIAESGPKNLNKWQTVRINVLDEYKKYFKEKLDKNPVAVAILTDGNAVHSAASCDYDDFKIGEASK